MTNGTIAGQFAGSCSLEQCGTGTGTGGMAVATAAMFRYLVEVKINE